LRLVSSMKSEHWQRSTGGERRPLTDRCESS
jgi:hypothetical protein